MPPPMLFVKNQKKMNLGEFIHTVPLPAHPAPADCSCWSCQGKESPGQSSKAKRHCCQSVHDEQPVLPWASLGTKGLEILWKKQRTGDSSTKGLQIHLPVS